MLKSARSGSAISGRAAGHRSCSWTACSRTVGSGGGRSTACVTSSRWWRGSHRAAEHQPIHPSSTAWPTTPTASPHSSRHSNSTDPTSSVCRSEARSRWSSTGETRGSREPWCSHQPTGLSRVAYRSGHRTARLQQALREAEQPPERFVPTWIPALLTPSAPSDLIHEITAIMSEFHPVGLRCMAHSLAESDLRDVVPHIDVPTLLLHGDTDVRSPLSVAQDLHARGSPTHNSSVIPGVGHLGNVQAPGRFNAAARAFLRSARAQPP